MIAIIASVLGILSTLVAWNLNPRRRLYAELDKIYAELERCYAQRDKALTENNTDILTAVTARIIELCKRKNTILERIR